MSKPADFTETHETRMIRKFGSKQAFERVKAAHGLIPRGAEVGLDASTGFTQEVLDMRVQSSTLNSHRLVLYITQLYGTIFSEKLYDQLNDRHFLKAGILNDIVLLQEAVASIGLSDEHLSDVYNFIASPQRGVKETLHLYEQTQRIGIDSIPTLVIDGQYMISGAAQASEIQRLIEKALLDGPTGATAFERMYIE